MYSQDTWVDHSNFIVQQKESIASDDEIRAMVSYLYERVDSSCLWNGILYPEGITKFTSSSTIRDTARELGKLIWSGQACNKSYSTIRRGVIDSIALYYFQLKGKDDQDFFGLAGRGASLFLSAEAVVIAKPIECNNWIGPGKRIFRSECKLVVGEVLHQSDSTIVAGDTLLVKSYSGQSQAENGTLINNHVPDSFIEVGVEKVFLLSSTNYLGRVLVRKSYRRENVDEFATGVYKEYIPSLDIDSPDLVVDLKRFFIDYRR